MPLGQAEGGAKTQNWVPTRSHGGADCLPRSWAAKPTWHLSLQSLKMEENQILPETERSPLSLG